MTAEENAVTNNPTPTPSIAALQRRTARMREALLGCGAFWGAARHPDPLPALRDLACDWLQAEDLDIIVPAGTGSLHSEDPGELCAPITIGRRVVGRLEAHRTHPPFDDDDRALARALGPLVGAVLEQSSMKSLVDQYADQAQANADTLDQLLTFGRRVVSATADPLHLALHLATQVPSMVGGERASLLLIPPDTPDEPLLVLSNGTVSSAERAREVLDNGLAGMVLRDRVPMIIDETDTDRRWLALTVRESESPTRCAMAVPLTWGNRLLGALTVTTTETHLFNTPQLNLLELVACHISLAIQAANLEARLMRLTESLADANARLSAGLHAAHDALRNGEQEALIAALATIAQATNDLGQTEAAMRLVARTPEIA
jgi:GAF domain-containing protein